MTEEEDVAKMERIKQELLELEAKQKIEAELKKEAMKKQAEEKEKPIYPLDENEIGKVDYEGNKLINTVIGFASILMGLTAYFGFHQAMKLLNLPEILTLLIGGMFAFITSIVLLFILLQKQVRRAIADVFQFNKKLSEILFFHKNRRVEIFDVKIPKGTRKLKLKGIKDEDGKPMEFDISQNNHIDADNNRVLFVLKDYWKTNIDEFIERQEIEQSPEESMIRELDELYAEKRLRMETAKKDNMQLIMLLLLVLNLASIVILIALQFLKK